MNWTQLNLLHPSKFPLLSEFIYRWTNTNNQGNTIEQELMRIKMEQNDHCLVYGE